MTLPLRQRYRVVLMREAWRRGTVPFLRQMWLLFVDALLRHKELVYRLDAQKVPTGEVPLPEGLHFQEAKSWEDIPQNFRKMVDDPSGGFRWNGRDWFGPGRRLWVGIQGGRAVALGWWLTADEATAHYFPIPPNTELLIHSVVLPEFRGKNLQMLLRLTLMQTRVRQGVRAFYVHVRNYNTPSLHTVEKLGFERIGHGTGWHFRRNPVWHIDI